MKYVYLVLLTVVLSSGLFIACNSKTKESAPEETMTAGTVTFYTDKTIQPIVEDVVAVFSSVYPKAHITQVNQNEIDIINAITRDEAKVVVLTRPLTSKEEAHFVKLGITARPTHFATDALAFITNKQSADTVVNLEDVYKVLRGKESGTVKKLVFDNPGSSTVKLLMQQSGSTQIPAKNVYSLKNTEDVIKYVHDNPGSIGVVGVNWLVQPPVDLVKYLEGVRVLGVDNVKIDKGVKKYYKPSQSNIATGSYPLTRKLYVLNYQGKDGLGMGFANYLSAQDGQRIILKSGLLPAEIPPREIEVRNEL